MSVNIIRLANQLDYQFGDCSLIEQALTHRSAGSNNYERLEFLGDAVLGMVVAEWLWRTRPTSPEGELTRLRASLVKRETLAQLAREICLGDYVRLGSGELKSGGSDRDSILADALEALFGAIYVESGLEACRGVIENLFSDLMANPEGLSARKDPKTRLQEYLQGRGLARPVYRVVSSCEDRTPQSFEVTCDLEELQLTATATAVSRKRAEQAVAKALLSQLNSIAQ